MPYLTRLMEAEREIVQLRVELSVLRAENERVRDLIQDIIFTIEAGVETRLAYTVRIAKEHVQAWKACAALGGDECSQ